MAQMPMEFDEISDFLSVTNVSFSDVSISANSYTDINIDVTKSGYTVLGVIGWQIDGHPEIAVNYVKMMSSTSARIRCYNISSTAISSFSGVIGILYRKN